MVNKLFVGTLWKEYARGKENNLEQTLRTFHG